MPYTSFHRLLSPSSVLSSPSVCDALTPNNSFYFIHFFSIISFPLLLFFLYSNNFSSPHSLIFSHLFFFSLILSLSPPHSSSLTHSSTVPHTSPFLPPSLTSPFLPLVTTPHAPHPRPSRLHLQSTPSPSFLSPIVSRHSPSRPFPPPSPKRTPTKDKPLTDQAVNQHFYTCPYIHRIQGVKRRAGLKGGSRGGAGVDKQGPRNSAREERTEGEFSVTAAGPQRRTRDHMLDVWAADFTDIM